MAFLMQGEKEEEKKKSAFRHYESEMDHRLGEYQKFTLITKGERYFEGALGRMTW